MQPAQENGGDGDHGDVGQPLLPDAGDDLRAAFDHDALDAATAKFGEERIEIDTSLGGGGQVEDLGAVEPLSL
ncbi:MAG TPA: hypothetical protein P5337_03695, partial [Aestuariivirga sp.]|nr:hypothetical protein [Aestuariivirga sp.]